MRVRVKVRVRVRPLFLTSGRFLYFFFREGWHYRDPNSKPNPKPNLYSNPNINERCRDCTTVMPLGLTTIFSTPFNIERLSFYCLLCARSYLRVRVRVRVRVKVALFCVVLCSRVRVKVALSCVVLCSLVLCCLVLSRLGLPCLVVVLWLSCLVLSCLALLGRVLLCLALS